MKVVKFGGSSLASATQFKEVHDIVLEDTDRHYVVPSAPGKEIRRYKSNRLIDSSLFTSQ